MLLRDPVERVFSLYCSLRDGTAAEQARFGLSPGFGFEAFIGSRHSELYARINNGVCRLLGADARLTNPDLPAFWRIAPDAGMAEQALESLERFDFGPVGQMEANGHPAGLPKAGDGPAPGIAEAQMIIRRNQLDLALHRRAVALFRKRQAGGAVSPPAPGLNQPIGLAALPDRQGFYPPEADGSAWLRPDTVARLSFAAPPHVAHILLQLVCATGDYPIDEIVVRLNGKRVLQKAQWTDDCRCTLQFAPPGLREERNELALDAPVFFSATRGPAADAPDHRTLSVAVAGMTLSG